MKYDKILDTDEEITKEHFFKRIVENRVSFETNEFDVDNVIKSLNIIELPVSADVIIVFKVMKRK